MRDSRSALVCAALTIITIAPILAAGITSPILPQLAPSPTMVVSTVPPNGDLNPYGVAFVPNGFPTGGAVTGGDVLVSNFNASSNLQGTGTTIVRIDPTGHQSLFFQGRVGLGLTTALGILKSGFILVGSLPTTKSSEACTENPAGHEKGVGHGAVLILDRQARVVTTLENRNLLDGPWDLTVRDNGNTAAVFVSDVLNGAVTRLDLDLNADNGTVRVTDVVRIASGYMHRCDANALVVGPTGVALDPDRDILYVASTGDNAIFAVPHAGSTTSDQGPGTPVIQDTTHLHGPLGLVRIPNGDLITTQGDAVNPSGQHPSEIVEYGPTGQFITQFSIDSAPGSAFGLALEAVGNGFRFAAVDDGTNTLDIWVVP